MEVRQSLIKARLLTGENSDRYNKESDWLASKLNTMFKYKNMWQYQFHALG